jgi:small subunit ribosomal protein S6
MCTGQRPKGGKQMNKYELAVVISAKADDEARAASLEKCKKLIERFQGTITDVNDAGKKKLAYEIQKMNEAYYYFIQFEAPATAPAEIEHRVRIVENVIRFLVVKADEE